MAQLKIKLAKSLNGRKKNHIATAYSLGLRGLVPGGEDVHEPSLGDTALQGHLAAFKKLIYTMLILLVVRVGSAIPVPFIDPSFLKLMVRPLPMPFSSMRSPSQTTSMAPAVKAEMMVTAARAPIVPSFLKLMVSGGGLLGYLDMLTGGAFSNATLFALSISPYITASIVIQLLTVEVLYLPGVPQRFKHLYHLGLSAGSLDFTLSAFGESSYFDHCLLPGPPEDRPEHCPAGQCRHPGQDRGGGHHQHLAGAEFADHLVGDGGPLQGDLDHVLLGVLNALADGVGDLGGLTKAKTYQAVAVEDRPEHCPAGQCRHPGQDRDHFPPRRGRERLNARRCR